MDNRHWQLGQLIFDPQRRILQLNGQHCALEPRQAALLLFLAQRAGEPVSREQLIEEIWQGRVVSEGAINRAVSLLRKACASLDPATDYIATIPKLGYCLLADASLISTTPARDSQPSTQHATSPAAEHDLQQIAAKKKRHVEPVAAKSRIMIWPFIILLPLILTVGWAWLQFSPDAGKEQKNVLIPIPVTSFDGAEFNISSSNDGQLLYHRRDSAGKIQLWLGHGQQDELLTTSPAHASNGSISPDGYQVVYRRLDGNQCQIILLTLQPEPSERVLFDCPADSAFQASWGPDSEYFYYRVRQDKTQPYLVYRYQIATTNQQQLTLADPASFNGAIALTLSADGKQLAIANYLTPDNSQLKLYKLITGQPPQLQQTTDLNIGVVDLTWPANRPLLLASSNQVYQLAEDLSLQHYFYSQQLINSISSNQQQLLFASQQQQADIWRQPLKKGADSSATADSAIPLIASSRLDILPRVNQLDSELLFLTTRQGVHQIWRKPLNGPEQMLSAVPAPAGFIRLSWSFDQRSVYFSQQGAVYQLELDNAQLTQLFSAEHQAFVINPGPDNNSLIYSSNKTGDWQLWRYFLNGKHHLQLTTQGGYSGFITGDTLYYSKFHQDGLWQLDIGANGAGNEEKLLLADFDKVNWLNWQLQDQSVVYYQPGAGIYHQALASDATPELLLAYSPELVHHYSVSNQAIYYVKRQPPQGDIYQLPLPSHSP